MENETVRKDESKLQTQDFEKPPFTSNFPLGRVSKTKQQSLAETRTRSTLPNSQSVASLDKKATKHSKGETREKESSSSDDGDEAYEDARDSLSRTESFFMSCSVSDFSGWDEQEVQPFGSFSSDHQQGRNFNDIRISSICFQESTYWTRTTKAEKERSEYRKSMSH